MLPVSRRTLASKGSKVVPVVHSDEKRQVTCIVGGDLAGGLLPLQIVYGPGAKSRLPKVSGVHTSWSHNHWASTDTTQQRLMDVLVPAALAAKRRLGLPENHAAILTWDVYAAHRSAELRAFIADRIPWLRIVYVPANCTDFLQVADVSLNTPFKRHLRQQCEDWLIDSMSRGCEADTTLRTLRVQVACWAKAAIEYVNTTSAARNGVSRVGLNLVWRQDWIHKAQGLHAAKHLWSSASRNDIVAPTGSAAAAAVVIPPSAAVVEISDDEEEAKAAQPRPRKRVFHCGYCRQSGHTKVSCKLYKRWKETRQARVGSR